MVSVHRSKTLTKTLLKAGKVQALPLATLVTLPAPFLAYPCGTVALFLCAQEPAYSQPQGCPPKRVTP